MLITNVYLLKERRWRYAQKQLPKEKYLEKKACLLATLGIIVSGISGFAVYHAFAETIPYKSNSVAANTADELFPTKTIPKEYETDNFYVQMNNSLLNAIYDYQSGKITEEEYFAKCKEIDEAINSKEGLEKLQKDEI